MELDAMITEVEQRSTTDDPLDRLAAAALRHEELADQADQLLDHFVQAAREANCSWAQIGEVLGVTKQAAQQRHGRWQARGLPDLMRGWLSDPKLPRLRGRRAGLFQRFTPRARNAVVDAQGAARSLGHDHVGTEHVMLGILRTPESVGAKALGRWSLTADDVEAEIIRRVGRADPGPESAHVRFDAQAKKSLELALREALQLGHNYIGTEHMLLGIVRSGDGVSSAILADRDISPDQVRAAVLDEIDALETDPDGTDTDGTAAADDEG
jgi:hypothetical protein